MEKFDSARLSESHHVCTKDLFTPIFGSLGVFSPPLSTIALCSMSPCSRIFLTFVFVHAVHRQTYKTFMMNGAGRLDLTSALKSCMLPTANMQGLYFTCVEWVWLRSKDLLVLTEEWDCKVIVTPSLRTRITHILLPHSSCLCNFEISMIK